MPFTIETEFVAHICNNQHAFIDNENQSEKMTRVQVVPKELLTLRTADLLLIAL